jgi:ligand-binding sensor domain-containing protein
VLRPISLAATLWFVALAWCGSAFALDPSLDISQYAHTSWRVRDGFVKGLIYAIAQTPDGYLWLGTDFGLYRFDGVRAVPWESQSTQYPLGGGVRSLLVGRDGTLWIGKFGGLVSLKDGRFTRYPDLDGGSVRHLVEDREGKFGRVTTLESPAPASSARFVMALRNALEATDGLALGFTACIRTEAADSGREP